MCVSKKSYYSWLRIKDNKKQKPSLVYLKKRIEKLFDLNKEIYDSLRIQKALEKEGLYYSRSYIAVLMNELGLKSVLSSKFRVYTTDSNHPFAVAQNVLNRNFTSLQIGEKWVSNITYIKVANQWNYVTTILDLAYREIVAWVQARKKRNITDNHIFHSDRGVQYASSKMVDLLRLSTRTTQSISRKDLILRIKI